MIDHPSPDGALAQARQARAQTELARCEIEELAAVLHRKPPVGRWPRGAQATDWVPLSSPKPRTG